jgi:[ribosomal protein S5]-alanine N-acetyltransferase
LQTSQYLFCSERIGFRWWTQNDIELARGLWGDASVTRLFSKEPLSDDDVLKRLTCEMDQGKELGIQYWPMFEMATNEHVGCGGLRPHQREQDMLEIGFHLRPSFWGKGVATESAKAVIKYATDHTKAKALFAGHHPENIASRNVILKLRFVEVEPEFYKPTGLLHPSYILKLRKSP